MMKKILAGMVVLLGCFMWPAWADLADIQPLVHYSLPADIMQVEFAHETWVYRLYEDGTIKKIITAREMTVEHNDRNGDKALVKNVVTPLRRSQSLLGSKTTETQVSPTARNNA